MKEQYWRELLEEAPVAVQACITYFQERYPGNWRARLLDTEAVLRYLVTRDMEITVANFGVPNRKDWYYEIVFRGKLWKHERNFPDYEPAADEAIIATFHKLETTLAI